jgi:type II secretory pathway pseudopilin PulG
MTLIEALIAGGMLAIGAGAVLSGWSTVNGVLEHQRRLTDATNVTRSHLEILLSLPSQSPALAGGTRTIGNLNQFGAPATGQASYRVDYRVTEDRPGPGFIELLVTTSWQESRGVQRSTSLSTYRER